MNIKRIVILVLFLIVISIGFGILYKRNFIEPFQVNPTGGVSNRIANKCSMLGADGDGSDEFWNKSIDEQNAYKKEACLLESSRCQWKDKDEDKDQPAICTDKNAEEDRRCEYYKKEKDCQEKNKCKWNAGTPEDPTKRCEEKKEFKLCGERMDKVQCDKSDTCVWTEKYGNKVGFCMEKGAGGCARHMNVSTNQAEQKENCIQTLASGEKPCEWMPGLNGKDNECVSFRVFNELAKSKSKAYATDQVAKIETAKREAKLTNSSGELVYPNMTVPTTPLIMPTIGTIQIPTTTPTPTTPTTTPAKIPYSIGNYPTCQFTQEWKDNATGQKDMGDTLKACEVAQKSSDCSANRCSWIGVDDTGKLINNPNMDIKDPLRFPCVDHTINDSIKGVSGLSETLYNLSRSQVSARSDPLPTNQYCRTEGFTSIIEPFTPTMGQPKYDAYKPSNDEEISYELQNWFKEYVPQLEKQMKTEVLTEKDKIQSHIDDLDKAIEDAESNIFEWENNRPTLPTNFTENGFIKSLLNGSRLETNTSVRTGGDKGYAILVRDAKLKDTDESKTGCVVHDSDGINKIDTCSTDINQMFTRNPIETDGDYNDHMNNDKHNVNEYQRIKYPFDIIHPSDNDNNCLNLEDGKLMIKPCRGDVSERFQYIHEEQK